MSGGEICKSIGAAVKVTKKFLVPVCGVGEKESVTEKVCGKLYGAASEPVTVAVVPLGVRVSPVGNGGVTDQVV